MSKTREVLLEELIADLKSSIEMKISTSTHLYELDERVWRLFGWNWSDDPDRAYREGKHVAPMEIVNGRTLEAAAQEGLTGIKSAWRIPDLTQSLDWAVQITVRATGNEELANWVLASHCGRNDVPLSLIPRYLVLSACSYVYEELGEGGNT